MVFLDEQLPLFRAEASFPSGLGQAPGELGPNIPPVPHPKGVMKHESLIHSGPWGVVTFKGSSGAPPADGLSPLHLC